jgi:pimeloyl-ACP methyl ester carboxylesterase
LEILLPVASSAVISIAILILAGILYQSIGTAIDHRKFPPPGRMLDVPGCRLHLIDSEAARAPAVIFESGISASCLNWTHVRTEVSAFARACAYDRAGLGWSELASTPRVTTRLIEELHALLGEAKIPSPYVLVGHSFGGLLVSAYAARYPNDVAGLILVDPLPVTEWLHPPATHSRTLARGVRLARRGALLARIGVVRLTLRLLSGGSRRIPRGIAKLTSGRGESLISRLVGEVRKMPRDAWPVIQSHWSQPKAFEAMADYLEALPESSAEAAALGPLPPIPVTILSASHSTPAQLTERDEIARHSPLGRHILAAQSGHWIHLDQPELVIHAIRDMVLDLSRNRGNSRAI